MPITQRHTFTSCVLIKSRIIRISRTLCPEFFCLLNFSLGRNIDEFPFFSNRREEVIRSSDKCRNEQVKIEAEIKEWEVKINDLEKQQSEIDKNCYNAAACKRNLQRQIKIIENLRGNLIG